MSGSQDLPAALIFRKRLLPWSETFIAAQGLALRRYHPVFVGYQRVAAGQRLLEGADQIVLQDFALLPPLSKALVKTFGLITPRWQRALGARRPAIVHAHFGVNAPDAAALARAFAVPLVVTFHGIDLAIPRGGSQRRQRARVFDQAARIIAVSEFIAERLRAAGCPAAKLIVHNIGVDTQKFAPGPADERELTTILFVGRLVEKKGAIHLLRAMPAVQQALPGAALVLAGDGPLRAQLEAEAARLGIRAVFLGVQTPESVRQLMRSAGVLCVPSIVAADGNAEGLPMTIMEAQAAGLPVVTFPAGGSAEGVVHGETGYVAEPRAEAELAAYLVDLLSDRDRWNRFSAAARQWALERFNLATQTGRLEDIYDAARGG